MKPKRKLSQQDLRSLASAGLTVVRYQPDGARATVRELVPESHERRQSFAQRLADDTPARDEEA